jgi:hypothetical protein
MAVETIFVHEVCNSQLVRLGNEPFYCEVCGRAVRPDEIKEVDNSPSPFAG